MDYNNNIYGMQQPVYGAPTPVVFNNQPMPQFKSSLTDQEINLLKNRNPSKFDLHIDPLELAAAMCNHKDNGRDLVKQTTDGSGDVYCPLCGERWSPETADKAEVKETVNKLISYMQNAKWVGDYGTTLIRDYFPMIPLLKKFADLYGIAMNNFDRYYNANGYNMANDASVYANYNSIMGYGGVSPVSYPNPYMNANPYMQAGPAVPPPSYVDPNTQYANPYAGYNMNGAAVPNPAYNYAAPNVIPGTSTLVYGYGAPVQNPMQAAPGTITATPGAPATTENPMAANPQPQATYAPAAAAQPSETATSKTTVSL